MATKRKRRRKSAVKRKSPVRKRRTTAKRRKNPRAKAHRITVYRTRKKGKKAGLRRSSRYRLKPRRVNPKFKGIGKYFGMNRMSNAVALIIGMGISALAKSFTVKTVANPYFSRFYGLLSIVAGATLNMKGRKKSVKAAGTGLVVFGLYDLLVQNIPSLKIYLPNISGPTFLTQADIADSESVSGAMSYGRSMMGASINTGPVQTVGASINLNMEPELIGDDIDIADALEMSMD